MNATETLSRYGFVDSDDLLEPALLGEDADAATLGWPSDPAGVLAAAKQLLSLAQSSLQSFYAHQRQVAASTNSDDRCSGYDTSYWGWLVNAGLNAIQASNLAGQFGGAAQSADANVQQWAARMNADPQFQTSRDPNGNYFDCIDVAWVDDLTSLIGEAAAAVQAAEAIYTAAMAPNPQGQRSPRLPGRTVRRGVSVATLGDDPINASSNLNAYGLSQGSDGSFTFDGSALISSGEKAAVGSLGNAIEEAIKKETEFAAFAASFMAGVVGVEAGITAALGGATIASAVAAGEAAGEAAALAVGSSLATGPGAPLLILVFALVIVEGGDPFAFLDGFDPFGGGHESCCGSPPDPKPMQYTEVGGNRVYVPFGVTVSGAMTETQDEATKRATQDAISKNSDMSCPGNHTIVQYVGPMAAMPVDGVIFPNVPGDDPRLGPFTNAANHMIYEWVNQAGLTRCWPLTQRASAAHMLALTLAAWNEKHAGPAVKLTRTVRGGMGPYEDLIALALDWGTLTWMTTQGQGYLGTVLPSGTGTPTTMHLSVNVGPLTSSGGGPSAGGSSSGASAGTSLLVGTGLGLLGALLWKFAPDVLKGLWSHEK